MNPLYYLIVIVTLSLISGCIAPDVPEPIPESTPTPISTPVPTPTPESTPTPLPTPPQINDTNESIYDTHNAAWLYEHGYYGSGGGGSCKPLVPELPVPELPTIGLVCIGLMVLCLICGHRKP